MCPHAGWNDCVMAVSVWLDPSLISRKETKLAFQQNKNECAQYRLQKSLSSEDGGLYIRNLGRSSFLIGQKKG